MCPAKIWFELLRKKKKPPLKQSSSALDSRSCLLAPLPPRATACTCKFNQAALPFSLSAAWKRSSSLHVPLGGSARNCAPCSLTGDAAIDHPCGLTAARLGVSEPGCIKKYRGVWYLRFGFDPIPDKYDTDTFLMRVAVSSNCFKKVFLWSPHGFLLSENQGHNLGLLGKQKILVHLLYLQSRNLCPPCNVFSAWNYCHNRFTREEWNKNNTNKQKYFQLNGWPCSCLNIVINI